VFSASYGGFSGHGANPARSLSEERSNPQVCIGAVGERSICVNDGEVCVGDGDSSPECTSSSLV
jgi:hypothetical protein